MSINIDFNPNKGVQTDIWNYFVDFIEENTFTDSQGQLRPIEFDDVDIEEYDFDDIPDDLNTAPTLKLDIAGGLGSGKTFTGVSFLARFALVIKSLYPTLKDYKFMCIAPNYDLCVRVGAGDLMKALDSMGFEEKTDYIWKENKKTLVLDGNIIFRFVTAEKPKNIAGDNVIAAWVDERHIISDQKEALRRTKARVRFGGSQMLKMIIYTGTPEYGEIEDTSTSKFKKFIVPTIENVRHVGREYIEDLMMDFTEEEQRCYIYGETVKITSSSVFYNFVRNIHVPSEEFVKAEEIADIWPSLDLYVSMDFNVDPFVALLWQQHRFKGVDNEVFVLKKVIALHNMDIHSMIDTIHLEYENGRGNIHCSPDSNQGRHTSSVYSPFADHAYEYKAMKNAGWLVYKNNRNPSIALSTQLVNNRLKKGYLMFILNHNTKEFIDLIDSVKWNDKGKIDEKHKHYIDCVRYLVWTWYKSVYEALK